MLKPAPIVVLALLVTAPAHPCDPAHTRLLQREVRAQEAQAKALQRQDRLLREQNKFMSRQQRQQ